MSRLDLELFDRDGVEAFLPEPPVWETLSWGSDLVAQLPDPLRDLAAELNLFLVGGIVRDAMLGLQGTDIDCVLPESDWKKLPLQASVLGWSSKVRGLSRTAVLWREDEGEKLSIEIAGMRKDYYEPGGSLVRTEPAGLRHDALRRDATMNCLYLRLSDGKIWDPFAAVEGRRWEASHPGTLLEDPLRVIRLWRFSLVTGLPLESQTDLQANSVAAGDLSGSVLPARLRGELDRAARQGVLGALLARMRQARWNGIMDELENIEKKTDKERSAARWCKNNLSESQADSLQWIWM